MKLYTEEQVKQIQQAILCNHINAIMDANYCLNVTNPIELPSDEEIDEYVKSTGYYGHCTHEYHEGIEEGAKYVINKIKEVTNEQQ